MKKDAPWLLDGLRELERAIDAAEWTIAWDLAAFIDRRVPGHIGVHRMTAAYFWERASA